MFLETRYYYDKKGQLIRQEDPGNAVKEYSYDLQGNRQSFRLTRKGQAALDVNLYYIYDDLHRLKQVRRDSSAGVIMAEYEYDVKGNRKTLRYPQAGMETSYTYNNANRVISLENKRQGTVISAWEYGYDRDGNLVSKSNKASSAPVTVSYRYDRLGRLTEEDAPGWKRSLYEYDACSNRTKMMVEGKTKKEPVSVTSYEYDLNNRLEKEIRKQGKVTETWRYRYDDSGNETFRIWEKMSPKPDYSGSVKLSGRWKREVPTVYEWRHYNGFHQLIRVNQDNKEITYQYRGDGLRHSSEVQELTESQSKTKVCYWDGSDIVAEQTDGGSVKRYLRGINLIAREADGMVYYYILNEHGDVTQLWGQSGTCKASYEYDAFGNERNPDKEDENPFRYCGEYLESETDTYYLRARSYRSGTGRFTSEDTLRYAKNQLPSEQEVIDPLSLNLYTYCYNNPVRFTDPSGNVPFMLLTGAAGALAGAVTAGIKSALAGKFSWKDVGEGALIGGAIGLTGGAAVSLLATGSAFAATGTVMGALGFGASATTLGTLGAAEFDQARLLLERSGSTAGEQLVNTVVPQATQAMVVTEELIRNTMVNAPLQTQQASVSLPVIQNYVDRILQGEVNIPPIKVDGNIIVDGNHRYIASQIAGIKIGIQQWTGARLDKVIEWVKVIIDSVDWGNR